MTDLSSISAKDLLQPFVPPTLRTVVGQGVVAIGLRVHHTQLQLAAVDAWVGGPQDLMCGVPVDAIDDLINRLRELQREATS